MKAKKMLLTCAAVLICSTVAVRAAQLYAYYSFDDSSQLAKDYSPSGLDLINNTTYNLPSYTAEGAVNGAAVLDGSTQGFLAVASLYRPGSFTASIWVKPATTVGQLIIQSSNSGKGYLLRSDPADYRVYIYYTGGNVNVRSGVLPVAGLWTHLTVRFISDGVADANGDYTGDAQIFVNGELKKTEAGIKYHPDGAGYLCLGKRATANFNGQLDEFAVFSGLLTDEEIGNLASKTATPLNVIGYEPEEPVSYAPPVAYYSFNDPNGTVFGLDDSGNERHLINDDIFVVPDFTNDGAVNGAAAFNGLGQAFRYNGGELCPYGAFSTSIWVRSQEIGLSAMIAVTRGYSIQLVSGEYRFYVNYSAGYTTIRLLDYVSADNNWVHLAMSYTPYGEPDANGDYIGKVEAYLNGGLVRSIDDVKYKLTGTGADYLYLGRRASDKFLKGSLDEFAVWDVSLQDWQVAGLATGKYNPLTIPAGLVHEADLNGDGVVNIEDFAILAGNWQKTSY